VSLATVRTLDFIGAELVQISGMSVTDAVGLLAADPAIEYAEPNYTVHAYITPNDPDFNLLWGMHNTGQTGGAADADIDAAEAWNVNTGGSVIVGVLDSGVDTAHADLRANIWTNPGEIPGNAVDDDNNGFVDDVHGWDFRNNDNGAVDDFGHGTHVAGTIAAVGNNGIGVVGVCWSARVMPLKFLDSGGYGTVADAIRALEYATRMGVRVTNNSWGGSAYSQALKDAIDSAGAHGVLFVVSAGNSRANIDIATDYPASYNLDNMITVAATDDRDSLADEPTWGSNFGPISVDLGAPGVDILSTIPGNAYASAGGTSMAAPHVTGVAALVWSQYPTLTHLQVKDRILGLADPIPALVGKCLTGARLNAFMALAEPDSLAPSPVSDLTVVKVEGSRVTLSWTATGDDALSGAASAYDVRYSSQPIVADSFGSATPSTGEPHPQSPGTTQVFTVNGLDFNSTYYFAIQVLDEWENTSAVSNSPSATTLGPPEAQVSPTDLSDSLLTGDSVVYELHLENLGESELLYRTEIEYPDLVRASGSIVIPAPTSAASGEAASRLTYRVSTGSASFDITDEWLSTTVLNVLLIYADGGASALKAILESYPDMGAVDTWKASVPGGSILGLAVLQNYDVVVAWNNEPWVDINAIGSVLADYIDGGGAVVTAVDCWSAGAYASHGRYFDSIGYSPFRSLGEALFKTRKLGAYDSAHAIMDGVDSLAVATFYNDIELVSGAVDVARWDDGTPLVATNPRTVALNVWPGDGYDWSGDFPTLMHNAVNYARGMFRWLSIRPATGEVAPSGDSILNASINARYLVGGDYNATIAIHTNAPDDSSLLVPVQLHVTGIPDIVVSDTLLDFGGVFIDAARVETLSVANKGTAALNISGIAIDRADYSLDVSGLTLEPYESRPIHVTFMPRSPGPISGLMTLFSDDPDEAAVSVNLLGEGIPSPDIVVAPESLVDTLLRGDTAMHTLTIRNDGTADLAFDIWVNSDTGMATSVMARGGGPDAFGYRWRDTRQPSGLKFDWMDVSGGTRLSLGDDDYVTGIPLGFTFSYYGVDYTTLGVAANGWQSFTYAGLYPGFEWWPGNVPERDTYHGIIAPFARDMVPPAGSYVRYQTLGAAPNRFFVLEYNHVPNYLGGSHKTFESVFYESSNRIKFQYLIAPDDPTAVGIENADETMGIGDGAKGDLYINPAWIEDRYAIEFSLWPSWLAPSAASATIPPGTSMDVTIRLDAAGLEGGDHYAGIVIASNDPDKPVATVPVHLHVPSIPDIALSDSALNFGPVYMGASQIETLSVFNAGSSELVVGDLHSDQADFSADAASFSVSPGDSHFTFVTFSPSTVGLVTGTLSVESNDPDRPNLTVALSGEGAPPPDIAVLPGSFTDSLLHGGMASHIVSIRNEGTSDLTFTLWSEATADAEQAFTGGGPDAFGYRWRDKRGPNGPDFEWIDASVGTSLSLTDDGSVADVPLGFTFSYYGADFTTVMVGSNGWLNVHGPGCCYCYALAVPDSDYCAGLIVPFGRDLYPPSANYVRYITIGTAPSRCFVVEYNDIPNYSGAAYKTFEAIVYERSNRIRFQYLVAPDDPLGIGIENRDENIGIGNAADGDLFIDPAWVQDGYVIEFVPPPQWLTLDRTGGMVPPGSSLDFGLTLAATALNGGDYYANVEIASDDPDESFITIPVQLHVTGIPDITVSDSLIDFGGVFVDGSHAETLLVTNNGTDVLVLTGIASDNPDYGAFPNEFSLGPGESQAVLATFAPSMTGPIIGTLSVSSNDPDLPLLTVSLAGEGVPPPVIAVDQEALRDSLLAGEVSTHTIIINNVGVSPLEWGIWPRAGASGLNREFILPLTAESTAPLKGDRTEGGSDGLGVVSKALTTALQDLTGMRIGFMGVFYDTIKADLVSRGATIVPVSFPLAAGILDNLSALAVDDAIGGASLTDLSRIRTWLRSGRGLLVQGDELESMDKNNALLLGTGISETYSGGYSDAVLTSILPHLTTTGVDSINATGYGAYCSTFPPAQTIVLDKLARPHAAVSSLGAGRVLAIGNEVCDRRYLGIGQTRLFANQVLDWLATGVSWLTTSPVTGTTAAGESDSLSVTFSAGSLDGGNHAARLLVSSNDPVHPQMSIPVQLEVLVTRLGDVNGDFRLDARDIIYLVNYTYRFGPEPIGGTGDVTCDETVSLADIIALVNHVFKGAPPFDCS
jgi:subtilisin family serine protease